jgi:hypothetical protein
VEFHSYTTPQGVLMSEAFSVDFGSATKRAIGKAVVTLGLAT